MHQTFHRFPRYCGKRTVRRRVVRAITSDFIRWYGAYPATRYALRLDGESGTMLSAILVLRYELSRCSPAQAARIDAVLPPKVRRGLRPLPTA